MTAPLDTIAVRAKFMLTMPDDVSALAQFDPSADLRARDAHITGLVEDGGVLIEGGVVTWLGEWRRRPKRAKRDEVIELETGVLTPGLVECHTHAVFAGHRAAEFAARNAGQDYAAILEGGGGILTTVEATRRASREELARGLVGATYEFVRRGVTTLEVKSGYGLSLEHETKQLVAIADAAPEVPCELVPCFLGAHAVPPERRTDRARYVDEIISEMIPSIAERGLARYCDVFCDRGAFTADEARRVLEAGQEHDMIARVHADELSDAGAARLAAEIGAASADHLEYTSRDALDAMARAGVVGVLMPAVNVNLHTTDRLADARYLLNAGAEIALSTDYNPGSAMTFDIGTILWLGCTLYRLTPGEALRAATIGAAKALRREEIGRIREGARANLALFDVPEPAYIPYHPGAGHIEGVIQDGELVYWTEQESA